MHPDLVLRLADEHRCDLLREARRERLAAAATCCKDRLLDRLRRR